MAATSLVPARLINRFSNPSSTVVYLWNSQLRQRVNQNNAQEALSLFRQMKQTGPEPDNLTFPIVSKACAKLSDLASSQIVHTHVLKSPFSHDVFVQTAVLDMYIKCGRVDFAHDVFVRMPERDVASWNAMLVGFAQVGSFDRVCGVFREMRFAGVSPDSVTVLGLCQGISAVNNLELARSVHSFGIRVGVDADVSVANTWISLYAKCGDLRFSESVFYAIERGLRSVVSWNSMIAAYANFEMVFDSMNLYKLMLKDGFRPDGSTIVSLLSSCVQPGVVFEGMQIHSHGIRFGCESNTHVVNTLISMYSKFGKVGSARCLFDNMCNKTCVSWTAMISGYAEEGEMDEALTLFHDMMTKDEKPDMVTVLSVISGCGQTGAFEVGKWIDAYASSNGLKDNIIVCNALMDMYAKCGSICNAKEIFYAMHDRTVVSWTTMIAGSALNGLFEEALDLFDQMVRLGSKPNHLTFLSVLQACTHAGLLEKGWECFSMMTNVYHINPGLDHYSCMVDLLGRKGKLKEALNLIQDIPVKPDAAIWSALLGACKIHQNIEIGEYAAHQLFELEPHVAIPYVELANIYASAGRWDGVAKTRATMNCKNVRKSPGQSLVEINGKTHAFTVEDRSHLEGELIYAALDSLTFQSREEECSLYFCGNMERELDLSVIFNM